MNHSNLLAYEDYIIDADTLSYRAVWNCQVEWTEECIFYDAETGKLAVVNDEPEFVRQHHHKVTNSEYREHAEELKSLRILSDEELIELLFAVPAK